MQIQTLIDQQPLSKVRWVPREWLKPNPWNPNHVAPPELNLLKTSIVENGWTQPIVVFEVEPKQLIIVDGENRWRLSGDPEVATHTGGRVPVVTLHGSEADLMIATVRHNRARGEHGVIPMASIVGKLLDVMPMKDIERRLGMEDEEVLRLAEKNGQPQIVGQSVKGFGKAWVPGHE
jgi:ParB-like chromosome segregation protein Spo0J